MKCGDCADAPPIDPAALDELVALPRLAGGEADEQRDQGSDRGGGVVFHPIRTSACATDRAPGRRPRSVPFASTTTIDGNFAVFHDAQCLDREDRSADGHRARRHHVGGRGRRDGGVPVPPQVPVGDDANQPLSPASTTHVIPSRLLDISCTTSFMGVAEHTRGLFAPVCMTCSTRIRRPAEPASWVQAREVLFAEARRTRSVIASASPSASAAVVLAVGTRFIGHASPLDPAVQRHVRRLTERRRGVPVIAISPAPIRRIASRRRRISSVSPLYDSAMSDVVFAHHTEVAVNRLGRTGLGYAYGSG